MFNVFNSTDYREIIRCNIYKDDRAKKGALSALAQAIPCQTSYLSRVMAGQAELSLEQADSMGKYFGLQQDEHAFFLLLVQSQRAATPSLRAHFQREIAATREARQNILKRVGAKSELSSEDQARYYSSWYYALAHVMSGIPSLQTKEALSQKLDLPTRKVSEILKFLVAAKLVQLTPEGRYVTGKGKIHLKKDAYMILQHHSNWRNQALRSMERDKDSGLHYSVLVNTSKKDAAILREMILAFIEQFMKVVDPSADEVTSCFSLDFFNPGH